MSKPTQLEIQAIDQRNVWHPYSRLPAQKENLLVKSAQGSCLHLEDGRQLIDGMASWWTAIHGYNHPKLNEAARKQLEQMSHVMFGGLTHRPAVELAELLVKITPSKLNKVFFSDSGSVSIEVAMKMALQYWAVKGNPEKCKFMTVRNGYHGDTLHAMSVCDPINGMHSLFEKNLPKQIFIDAPSSTFGSSLNSNDLEQLEAVFRKYAKETAAFIIEPVVQGAGGMRFYSAEYLKKLRSLSKENEVLLILDEIATGFGRTGKLFAAEHAEICPDILAIGKALTGGYLSFAATLCTDDISNEISRHGPFMHGPTFMANPLACAVSKASIELLLDSDWSKNIKSIESTLKAELMACSKSELVKEVRVLGAIGVLELIEGVDVSKLQDKVTEKGVWLRPFKNLLYTMPPYNIERDDLLRICSAIKYAVDVN